MEKPIRILHVLGRLDRGGAETMVMNLYRNIDRSKIQFDFVIHTREKCDYNDEIYKLGGKIYNIPRYYGKNHYSYKKAWRDFFSSHTEYKVIHGHMRSTASIYLRIAKRYGLKTIAHSHSTASRGNIIDQLVKNMMQFPIRFIADYLFACSMEAGEWLFGKSAVKKDNYKIIKNAIDAQKYQFSISIRNRIRKYLNVESKFVIGHVGSFTYPKNHKYLLRVFRDFLEQNKHAILLLIGEGELKPEIERDIQMLGLEDKVIMTGSVSNVNDYLHGMDFFVFPSLFEGLGIAVIEAQASGLPCIVSDKVPEEALITEMVEIMPIDSSKKWANTIFNKKTINKREDTLTSIVRHGYDIKDQVQNLQSIYLDIVSNKK